MTVYSTDLTQVLHTIRETLADRVATSVTEGTARLELAGVIEALDNLTPRVSWDPAGLRQSCECTEELAGKLGLAPVEDGCGDVSALRRRRRDISEVLAETYRSGTQVSDIVSAVARFSDIDVREQISTALRGGLPD
ncbi:hypothetical protein [Rhodococcus koreensis]